MFEMDQTKCKLSVEGKTACLLRESKQVLPVQGVSQSEQVWTNLREGAGAEAGGSHMTYHIFIEPHKQTDRQMRLKTLLSQQTTCVGGNNFLICIPEIPPFNATSMK